MLLTNAVLYGRDNRARRLRRSLHGAVAAAFGVAESAGEVREGGGSGSLNTGENTGDGEAGAGFRITP